MKRYIKSATSNYEDFEIDENGVLVKYNGNSANVVIPDGVTSIGKYAFEYNEHAVNITIPNSVTSIGKHAFYKCGGLESITIPDGVTSIGSGAFSGCESLRSITIPDGVTAISRYAFARCIGLKNIKIPDSVKKIDDWAFYNCTSLTSISLPDNVKLGAYVFEDTPLESKFKKGKNKVVEPEEDEYDEFDQEAAEEKFAENLEDLVRQNYDVIDYFEEPSIQGGVGSDVITMTLNDGKSYSFWFDFEDETDTILTDGPESAARQYFAKIQDGIDSGEALVEE